MDARDYLMTAIGIVIGGAGMYVLQYLDLGRGE